MRVDLLNNVALVTGYVTVTLRLRFSGYVVTLRYGYPIKGTVRNRTL